MKPSGRDDGRMVRRPIPKVRRPNLRPAPPPLFVGQWIRALGKKPSEVAKGAPVNEGYLSEIINGRKKAPSIQVLHAIAVFLKIPRDLLHRPPPSHDVLKTLKTLDPSVLAQLHGAGDQTPH